MFLIVICIIFQMVATQNCREWDDDIINKERERFRCYNLGSKLSESEKSVNSSVVKLKIAEINKSKVESNFLPAKNFLSAKQEIDQSKVFQFIQKLPKGSSLHTHLLAAANVDFVISMTYDDNVYGCHNDGIFKLKVLKSPIVDTSCQWKALAEYREDDKHFDEYLRKKLTVQLSQTTRKNVWNKFRKTFPTLYELISYKPNFEKYVYQALKELYDDNVMYGEFRGTFMPLYTLNNTTTKGNIEDFLNTFINIVNLFKLHHPKFLGAKYIFCIYRAVTTDILENDLKQFQHYHKMFPDFLIGIDFVGPEEDQALKQFYSHLDAIPDTKFYLHAGETNDFGNSDLNLLYAIMLNSSRIGHGFALAKHKEMMKMTKKRRIAIELCPISNQVLKLNEDPRNHPATVLLSAGIPVVICNDDPAVWDAKGLSYDWYIVFMSMTWESHGLEILKQFAEDSITFSGMNEMEKLTAHNQLKEQWNEFVVNEVKNK